MTMKNNKNKQNNMLISYMFLVVIFLLLNPQTCHSIENEVINETTKTTNNKKVKVEDSPYYEEIQNLSDNELEAICTDRGFEIVKENGQNNNNQTYTREDYMLAASQCLAIEAEMAKVIEENPEILQELKDETNQMKQQKELLEKELLDAHDQLSSMKKIEEKEEDSTLFVTPTSKQEEKSNVNQKSEKQEEEQTIPSSDNTNSEEENVTIADPNLTSTITEKEVVNDGTEDDAIDLDIISDTIPQKEGQESQTTASTTNTSTNSIDIDDQEGSNSSTTETTTTPSVEEENPPKTATTTSDDKEKTILLTKIDASNHTLTDIINEVNTQILRDIKFVINTILPESIRTPLLEALQPFLIVGKQSLDSVLDIIKRYVSVMTDTVKDEVKNRQKKFMQQQRQ